VAALPCTFRQVERYRRRRPIALIRETRVLEFDLLEDRMEQPDAATVGSAT